MSNTTIDNLIGGLKLFRTYWGERAVIVPLENSIIVAFEGDDEVVAACVVRIVGSPTGSR